MEGLRDLSIPETEISRRAAQEEATYISFSFITDDNDLNDLHTINETVADDYSEASTALVSTNSSRENEVLEIITRIAESPSRDHVLNSQLDVIPDSSLNFSRPSPSTPNGNDELSDDDILPPSPNPPRTPSNKAGSAFVMMATGSPVQGSLRTLRNIELSEASSSTEKSDKKNSEPNKEASATKEKEPLIAGIKELAASSKAMRQIQFESDNSSQSATESPSLFVLEPGHAPVDSSIPKPTFSRPQEQAHPGDDSVIEIVDERKPAENITKTPPIVGGSSPSLSQEADSATQEFTPKLFKSDDYYSQDILNLTPSVESQNLVGSEPSSANQTPKIVDCLETQDLLRSRSSAEVEFGSGMLSAKLELSLESQIRPSGKVEHTSTPNQTAISLSLVDSDIGNHSKEESKSNNVTVECISSSESTPEVVKDEWITFEAIHRFYNPLNKTWTVRTILKDLPLSKLDVLSDGSMAQYTQLGLFDNMETETHQGSRLETYYDLLHKNHGSSGYHADVETSKSDSRTSRFSVSTFEAGHLGMSTTSYRPSLELSALHGSGIEFAVPRNPAIRPKNRSSSMEPKTASPAAGVSTETASPLLESKDVPDAAITVQDAESPTGINADSTGEVEIPEEEPTSPPADGDAEKTEELTGIRTLRKRGRKPKVSDVTEESSDSSKPTPRKKGRRGRPSANDKPVEGTPSKESSKNGAQKEVKEPETTSTPPQPEPGPSTAGTEPTLSQAVKASELEAVLEWRDIRTRPIDIGMPVFAQWTDKCYYAAVITHRDAATAGKWKVKFEDGQTRTLVEDFILPLKMLQKKQSIMVLNESLGEGRPAIVVGYHNEKDELHYVVELDNGGTVVVPRKRICMTQDQIRLCHDSIVVSQLFSPATCSVSMDNIVSGKRRRVIHAEALLASPARTPMSPKSRSETPSGGTPRTSRTSRVATESARKKLRGKRDALLDSSTQSSSSQSILSQSQTDEDVRHRIFNPANVPLAGAECGILEHPESSQEEVPVDEKLMGPLPKSDEPLFKGFGFILTKTTKTLEVPEEKMTDILEQYQEQSPPYNKDYIKQQLEAGGGVVLERFDQLFMETDITILVICNRPCRTERYIRSLAANIRSVSHLWVYDCCKSNKQLPWRSYGLPSGIDLDGNVVEWSPTTGRCLNGTRILLTGPRLFLDLWQPILMQAQCVVVFRLPATGQGAEEVEMTASQDVPPDYVVTTAECPARIVEQAKRMKIPVVSSEWVIQSLMHGRKLKPTDKAQFDYKYAP